MLWRGAARRGQHCPAPPGRRSHRGRGDSAEPPLPAWERGALPGAVLLFCHGEIGAFISQGYSRGTPLPHISDSASEQRRWVAKSHLCARWLPWPNAQGDPQTRRKDVGVLQPLQELRNRGMLCQHFPHRVEDSKGQVAVGLPKSSFPYPGSPSRSGTGESVICVAGRAGHCRGLAISGPSMCDRKCRITTPTP